MMNWFYRITTVFADGPSINTADSNITDFGVRIINYFLPFLVIAAVVAIIYAGLIMVTSSGDPEKLQTAKRQLLWTVLGVILVAFAIFIVLELGQLITKLLT